MKNLTDNLSNDVGSSLQTLQEINHVDKTNSDRDEIRIRSNDVRDEQVKPNLVIITDCI